MGIPPKTDIPVFPQVLVPYIQTAYKTDFPIDNNDFPMVAEIEFLIIEAMFQK